MKWLAFFCIVFLFAGCNDDASSQKDCSVYSKAYEMNSSMVEDIIGGTFSEEISTVFYSEGQYQSFYREKFANDPSMIDFNASSVIWITVGPGSTSIDMQCFQAAELDDRIEVHYTAGYPDGDVTADYNFETFLYALPALDPDKPVAFYAH